MNDFRMPAEWERHSATILGWPESEDDWPNKIEAVEHDYCEFIRLLTYGEKVKLICNPNKVKHIEILLKRSGVDLKLVDILPLETNRVWTRDTGPIFVKSNNTKKIIKFNFNAWAKYDDYQLDQKIPDLIAKQYSYQIDDHTDFTLEGGSIEVNGDGILITTEECLLDQNIQVRNKGLTKEQVEQRLSILGINKTIWLDSGIAGDDTHGHIDDFCRFTDKNTIILAEEKNKNDYNHKVLEDGYNRLREYKDLEIIRIPMPSPVYYDGNRLPASYANFYISNSAVLVPTFNDKNDRIALGILSDLFTDRDVIGIHAVNLILGLGSLHCLSQQEPE